jgi:ribose transport system permease protein
VSGTQGRVSRAMASLSEGRYLGVLVGLAVLIIVLALTQPTFMTVANWQEIARSQSVTWLLALGSTFVILTIGIDLSIASQVAVAGMAFGLSLTNGSGIWLAIAAALVAGLIMGAINGVFIGMVRISFFVVTLATLSIYQSIALLSTNAQTISLFTDASFLQMSDAVNGSLGPVPIVFIVVVGVYLLGGLILGRTRYGRAVYAVGSNAEAARLTGVPTRAILVSVYAVSGLMCGLASLVAVGRLSAASPISDPNLTLATIAAVLIGGVAFSGGDGRLIGTFLGVLFLGLIQNAISLIGVSSFWQGLVSGLILLVAVGLGVLRDHEWVHRLAGRSLRGGSQQAQSSQEEGSRP